MSHRAINLGCGKKRLAGYLNVDIDERTGCDQVVDLNKIPWPFPDAAFNEILAMDVIEHLNDIASAMREIHRIAKPEAIVTITTPHFSCANAFTDPTHRFQLGFRSFDSFIDSGSFARVSARIFFYPSLINKAVWRLANRFSATYEKRWAWIFPAWFMEFRFQVRKHAF